MNQEPCLSEHLKKRIADVASRELSLANLICDLSVSLRPCQAPLNDLIFVPPRPTQRFGLRTNYPLRRLLQSLKHELGEPTRLQTLLVDK